MVLLDVCVSVVILFVVLGLGVGVLVCIMCWLIMLCVSDIVVCSCIMFWLVLGWLNICEKLISLMCKFGILGVG